MACDSGTDFGSFIMFPEGRNTLFSVLYPLLSDICGPFPLPLGFPTPQSSASLFPSPSLHSPSPCLHRLFPQYFQIFVGHFYCDMMFDYPANSYPVYFNLKTS